MSAVARKASAQAKRAMKLASSRGISLKSAWGIVKRGGGKRKGSRKGSRKSPRKGSRMGKKRRGGGRRKGFVVTPKSLAKLLVVGAGIMAAKPLYNEVAYIVTNADQIAKEGSKSWMQHGKQVAQAAIAPAAIILVGPKLIDAGVKIASKGTTVVNRVANAKLVRV